MWTMVRAAASAAGAAAGNVSQRTWLSLSCTILPALSPMAPFSCCTCLSWLKDRTVPQHASTPLLVPLTSAFFATHGCLGIIMCGVSRAMQT